MFFNLYSNNSYTLRVFFSDLLLICSKRTVHHKLRLSKKHRHVIDLPKDHRAAHAWNKKYLYQLLFCRFRPFKNISHNDKRYYPEHIKSVEMMLDAFRLYKLRRTAFINKKVQNT